MNFFNVCLRTSTAVVLGVIPALAGAQESVSSSQESMNLNEGGSDEILVTARRRSEDIQTVPLAIAAFSSEDIANQQLDSVEDLTRVVAGFTYDVGGFPNDTRPALRGMQAERGRPSVAVLLDGHDLSGENLAIAGGTGTLQMNLFDLERIEVVKGPQATLYGRNAFAGAINYISKAPSFDFEARVAADAATGGQFGVSGSASGALINDLLAVRLNANLRHTDGFYRNPVTNERLGAERNEGLAIALLLTPASGLSLKGRYQFGTNRATQPATAFLGVNARLPIPGGTFRPGAIGTPFAPCPADLSGLTSSQSATCTRGTVLGTISADESDIDLSLNPVTGEPHFGMRMRSDIVSGNAKWETGFGTFAYDFGYLRTRTSLELDGDYTNFAAPPGPSFSLNILQALEFGDRHTSHTGYWTHEISGVSLLLGYQRFDETSNLTNNTQIWLRNPLSPLAGPPFNLSTAPGAVITSPGTTVRDTGYDGFFGGIGYEVLPGLTLNAEARYSRDTIRYDINGIRRQDVSLFRYSAVCVPTLPQASNPSPGTVNACPSSVTIKSSVWNPRLSVSWELSDDAMLFASYATGFKPGGANTNDIASFDRQTYRPESVTTYELGLKSGWLNNRLTANIGGYINRYKDQQIGVQFTAPAGTTGFATVSGIINAARVNIWGLEADLRWRMLDALTLTANYSYVDATFGNFVQGPAANSTVAQYQACGVPDGQSASTLNLAEAGNICADYSGNQVGRSPRHALNLAAIWRKDVGRAKVYLEVNSNFRSSRFVDEANLSTIPSLWLAGAQAGVDFGNFSVKAYVTNLFNNQRIQSAQRFVDAGAPDGFGPGRGHVAYLPTPRVAGVQLIVHY